MSLSLFISLSLVWFASPSEVIAQVSPGTWVSFEFTPSKTVLHVRTDSILQRISDSLRIVRDELAGLSGLNGDGLADRLAYWINDSTLSLWMPISEVQTAMNMATGMRDSSWLGRYDIPADEWDTPAHVDEPPYPDWFTKDWRKWEKYGLYVDPTSPIQMACHARGDSVMIFEFKLPKARLLEFLGIDTTYEQLPGLVGYVDGENLVSIADSGANILLAAGAGLRLRHERSPTGDSLSIKLYVDWETLKDSVAVWAGGGSGASTFLDLTDTPASYTGHSGKIVRVDPTETSLIFDDPPSVPSTIDTTLTVVLSQYNADVQDSSFIWLREWIRPVPFQFMYDPAPRPVTDSNWIGYKEYDIVTYIADPASTFYFRIRADSVNNVWIAGITIRSEGFGRFGTQDYFMFNMTMGNFIWVADKFTVEGDLAGTQDGSVTSNPVYPYANAAATRIYPTNGWTRSTEVFPNNFPPFHTVEAHMKMSQTLGAFLFMKFRVYFGQKRGSPASLWDVKLEDF
jgi:hypothetical protein